MLVHSNENGTGTTKSNDKATKVILNKGELAKLAEDDFPTKGLLFNVLVELYARDSSKSSKWSSTIAMRRYL